MCGNFIDINLAVQRHSEGMQLMGVVTVQKFTFTHLKTAATSRRNTSLAEEVEECWPI